jgi:signal transduction histidine kinase
MNLNLRPPILVLCLLFVWAIATTLVFVKLARDAEDQIQRQAELAAINFDVNWIVRPDYYPHLFRTMRKEYFEDLARKHESFRSVVLTWARPDGDETILYPTERILRSPSDLELSRALKRPLLDPYDETRTPRGYLYFRLIPWKRWVTPLTFLLAALNVLLLSVILLVWLSRVSARYVQSQSELEQKKLELIQLEQLALAGRLSAGLLHDLKKPVIHIREEASEEPTPATLRDIREQSELFLSMLRESGLEGFARRRATEEECCDVIDLVERSLRLVAYERNDVEVAREFDEATPMVWGRPTRLMQVFSNLILNAYQAMRGRGKLTVKIGAVVENEGRKAVVTFADTGPGIPPENRERVFEPFFTEGKEGSGLGLYISRTIVEDLGGRIEVEEVAAPGASFKVVLPEGN